RRSERGEAAVPSRGVVVVRVEALERGLFEELDHRLRLRSRLPVLNPGQRIAARSVELADVDLNVTEVRPAQAGQLPRGDQGAHFVWRLRRNGGGCPRGGDWGSVGSPGRA